MKKFLFISVLAILFASCAPRPIYLVPKEEYYGQQAQPRQVYYPQQQPRVVYQQPQQQQSVVYAQPAPRSQQPQVVYQQAPQPRPQVQQRRERRISISVHGGYTPPRQPYYYPQQQPVYRQPAPQQYPPRYF